MNQTAFTERKSKMLTKEECEKALNCLADDDKMDELAQNFSMDDDYVSHANYEIARKWCYDQLKQCIDEHFSNPPLEFEELKENMWVWDNKDKYYFQCNPRISTDMAECVWYGSFWYNTGEGHDEFYEDYIEFEENRFYRKEVQE